MLTFCVLGAQRGGRAIVIREEFVASAPLCVAIFSSAEPGLLRRDNRMRRINHSIHLISAIVYTAPFIQRRADRRRARDQMRQSNKIFTIPNKLSGRPWAQPTTDTNNGRVPANDIICTVLIPLAVVRVAIKRTIKRALGPRIDAIQGVINAKVNKPVIRVKYNDGVLTVRFAYRCSIGTMRKLLLSAACSYGRFLVVPIEYHRDILVCAPRKERVPDKNVSQKFLEIDTNNDLYAFATI